MTVNTALPETVTEQPHVVIPMQDGTRLSARIWLPERAAADPVPAILEYLPYRKRDGTTARDALTHPYFAGHGYAAVRVDMRGSGDSEGLLLDEYSEQELADAEEVIGWLRRQSWCNGRIGMMGISWGGFNSLQVAARRPPGLQAVVTLCSTDDRYADDIHYKGGALLNENLGWAGTILSYSSRPPDPEIFGSGWREAWIARLEGQPFWPALWLAHPARDAYWRHGSVCENPDAIDAAVLAVGGWGDAYKNAVPRLVQQLSAPAKGIIGPWVHKYPHFAVPEPKIGFLQEALRWWDHWLKDADTGAGGDPAFRAYVMHSVEPKHWYTERPGYWIAEQDWPSQQLPPLHLNATAEGTLQRETAPPFAKRLSSPADCGLMGGEYCAIWLGPEMPGDQRRDDALSLCFESAVLEDPLAIVGAPEVTLQLQVNKPKAQVCVRLCDIHPDGAATRITYGVLHLSCRESNAMPADAPVDTSIEIRIKMDDIAYQIPAGHTLRLSVSTSYWPLLWPVAEPVTATIEAAAIEVPRFPAGEQNAVSFPEAETAPPWEIDVLREPQHQRRIVQDQVSGHVTLIIEDDFGEVADRAHGLVSGSVGREEWGILPDDPLSANGKTHWTQTLSRGDWSIRTEAKLAMHADATNFHLSGSVEAYENEQLIFERQYTDRLPRGHL